VNRENVGAQRASERAKVKLCFVSLSGFIVLIRCGGPRPHPPGLLAEIAMVEDLMA
jgi:hypothetical protein